MSFTPAKTLFLFTFLSPFVYTFYDAWEIRPPVLIEVLVPIVFASLFWSWLREDSGKNSSVKWPAIDLGFFIYFAWFAIVPYHLFKTRGIKGSLGILAFVGVYLAGWLMALLVIYTFWWMWPS